MSLTIPTVIAALLPLRSRPGSTTTTCHKARMPLSRSRPSWSLPYSVNGSQAGLFLAIQPPRLSACSAMSACS